jgi:hypothetical protein
MAGSHRRDPHWGLSLAYLYQEGSDGEQYQYSYGNEFQYVELEGETDYRITLKSLSLLLHYRCAELRTRLDGSLFLGGGLFGANLEWHTTEAWDSLNAGLPSTWENSWQFTGEGTGFGYTAGGELSYGITQSVVVCLGVQYQGLEIDSLKYQEHVYRGIPSHPWLSDLMKPTSLDAAGWVALAGLGVRW